MAFDINYKRNLIAGTILSVVILLISSVASWFSINQLLESQQQVAHTNEIILGLENVISRLKDAETGQRGYLLTGETQFLEPYEGAKEDIWAAYDRISLLTSDNPEQQKDLAQVSDLINERYALLERSVEHKRAGIPINWQNIEQGRIYMQKLREVIKVMEQREQTLLKSRTERFSAFSAFTPFLILLVSVVAIVVTVVFFLRLRADYRLTAAMQDELVEKERQVQRKIEAVKGFAEEVAAGNYQKRISKSELE